MTSQQLVRGNVYEKWGSSVASGTQRRTRAAWRRNEGLRRGPKKGLKRPKITILVILGPQNPLQEAPNRAPAHSRIPGKGGGKGGAFSPKWRFCENRCLVRGLDFDVLGARSEWAHFGPILRGFVPKTSGRAQRGILRPPGAGAERPCCGGLAVERCAAACVQLCNSLENVVFEDPCAMRRKVSAGLRCTSRALPEVRGKSRKSMSRARLCLGILCVVCSREKRECRKNARAKNASL